MKKTLLIFALILSIEVVGQDSIPDQDTVCLKRGHVMGSVASKTLLYCPSYIEEKYLPAKSSGPRRKKKT